LKPRRRSHPLRLVWWALHSVVDFDTQSAFNRWWTTTFKAFFNKGKEWGHVRIISNLCKMFWLLSHKHYLVLSLLILTDIMIMTFLVDKLTSWYECQSSISKFVESDSRIFFYLILIHLFLIFH
jgi:hypothetical protein